MRVAFLAGFSLIAACAEFELVGLEPNLDPALTISIAAVRDETDLYQVAARLDLGTDDHGRLDVPADAALRLERDTVHPTVGDFRRTLIYQWSETRQQHVAPDSVLVSVPAMRQHGNAQIIAPIPGRLGARGVPLTDGMDLKLSVTPINAAQYRLALESARWTLQVKRRCLGDSSDPLISLQGDGAPPNELLVPSESLQSVPDGMVACVYALNVYQSTVTQYAVRVVVSLTLGWRLHR